MHFGRSCRFADVVKHQKISGMWHVFWINAWLIRYHHPDIIHQMRKLTYFTFFKIFHPNISCADILVLPQCLWDLVILPFVPKTAAFGTVLGGQSTCLKNKCFEWRMFFLSRRRKHVSELFTLKIPPKLTPWKLTAGIWVTAHLKISPSSSPFRLSTWVFTNSLDGDMPS